MQNDFGGHSYPYEGELQPDEKTMALLAHALATVTGFLGPLIIWLVKKDQSPYVRKHALEALVFSLATAVGIMVLYIITCVITGFCFLGAVLFLVPIFIWLASVFYFIIAAIRANEGKIYEYPLTSSFVK